jgi:hypothetical protein
MSRQESISTPSARNIVRRYRQVLRLREAVQLAERSSIRIARRSHSGVALRATSGYSARTLRHI